MNAEMKQEMEELRKYYRDEIRSEYTDNIIARNVRGVVPNPGAFILVVLLFVILMLSFM